MELLKELYGISAQTHKEKDMIAFVSQKLTDLGVSFTIDKAGNIYVTKGKAATFPCIAAHLDEVHQAREKGYEVLFVKDEFIIGFNSGKREFNGIGADDKNGIWICLRCLEKYDNSSPLSLNVLTSVCIPFSSLYPCSFRLASFKNWDEQRESP